MSPVEAADLLETAIAVRGLPIVARREGSANRDRREERGSDLALVLDTETRVDHTQRLLFGSAQLYGPQGYLAEWLYYPSDLAPGELAILQAYVLRHPDDAGGHLRLMPVAAFLRRVFARVAYRERGLVVGFNVPWDLSRFALQWSPASGWFSGGFSMQLFEWTDEAGRSHRDRFLPNIRTKAMGSKRQTIDFAGVERGAVPNRGRFLDLHQLAYALTDRSYTLDGAAEAFGVEQRKAQMARHGVLTERYIHYNRQDVRTTHAVYEALMAEWRRLPIA